MCREVIGLSVEGVRSFVGCLGAGANGQLGSELANFMTLVKFNFRGVVSLAIDAWTFGARWCRAICDQTDVHFPETIV